MTSRGESGPARSDPMDDGGTVSNMVTADGEVNAAAVGIRRNALRPFDPLVAYPQAIALLGRLAELRPKLFSGFREAAGAAGGIDSSRSQSAASVRGKWL
eukprot:Skav200899  [mRNA]  locus=scaffold1581:195017:196233:+ [translate_table: standard]